MLHRILLIIILLSLPCVSNGESNLENNRLNKRLDDYLSMSVSTGFSGAILVAKEGEIIFNQGYGMANKESHILIKPSTIFDIGSVSKQFTAAAILKLVELGKLKVSDNLSDFFQNLPKDKKDITIHQLLIHSAGLIDRIGKDDFDHIPTALFFEELFATKLLHKPGTQHYYSNSGYSILARIIELVSGQGYEEFLYQHLFKPAGMEQTGYLKPLWNEKLFALGYRYDVINIGSMAARYKKEGKVSWVLKGNGGINSTTQDMFKWYMALRTNKVLSKSQTNTFTTPYIAEDKDNSSFYSYGWAIFNSSRKTKLVTHNGSNGIFFHDFIWLPEEDIVIIYSTNSLSRQVGAIAWRIEKMLFDESYIPPPVEVDFMTTLLRYSLEYSQEVDSMKLDLRERFKNQLNAAFYLNRLGNLLIEEKRNRKALAVYKLNSEIFPKDGNTWDSLGEGYLANNQLDLARASFKKAIELKTSNNCFWCENASKRLIQLEK
ncbi:MAG: serine hydrolase [Kangiellaceae bacterium]